MGIAMCALLAGCVFPSTTYDGRGPGKIKRAKDKAQLLQTADQPDARTSDGRFFLYEFSREREWILTDTATLGTTLVTTHARLRALFEFDSTNQITNVIIHECDTENLESACAIDFDSALKAMIISHYDQATINQSHKQSGLVNAHADEWFAASTRGDIDSMQHLLGLGIPIMLTDNNGRSALHIAAIAEDIPTVDFLLDRGAALDGRETATGNTALHIAAALANRDLASTLIANGADVESKDLSGKTPLHHAALENAVEVADLLITAGAKVNAQDIENTRPLEIAVKRKYRDVVNTLLEGGAEPDWTMRIAAETGDVDLLSMLLKAGSDIDGTGWLDVTSPIEKAAENGHYDAVKFLIENGASAKKGNPVFAAVKSGDYALLKLLLENGAKANRKGLVQTAPGKSEWVRPLGLARSQGRDDIAALLLNYGAKQ